MPRRLPLLNRVPRVGSPASSLVLRRSDSSTPSAPLRLLRSAVPPDCCGDGEASQVPGGPSRACPAPVRPRRDRYARPFGLCPTRRRDGGAALKGHAIAHAGAAHSRNRLHHRRPLKCPTPPGGGDVKGARILFRRCPDIGRSVCGFARTLWCAVTDCAIQIFRLGAERQDAVGDERCAGKWRVEVNIDVPEQQGTILLVGPRGPWLQSMLRGRII